MKKYITQENDQRYQRKVQLVIAKKCFKSSHNKITCTAIAGSSGPHEGDVAGSSAPREDDVDGSRVKVEGDVVGSREEDVAGSRVEVEGNVVGSNAPENGDGSSAEKTKGKCENANVGAKEKGKGIVVQEKKGKYETTILGKSKQLSMDLLVL